MAGRMQKLRLRQLDRGLEAWRSLPERPSEGWLRSIRTGLGMTLADLGRRLGSSPPAISQIERAEREDSITLGTLRAAAAALDCDLVYALVPRRSLQALLEREAEASARREVDRVRHSMALEAQDLPDEEVESQVRERTEELLAGNWRRIWKKR